MGIKEGWKKNWQYFKDPIAQVYRRYHTQKKSTAAAHGYGASGNHAHKIDDYVMIVDAMQALENETIEDKDEMANFTSTNLTLLQILNQAQEAVFPSPRICIHYRPK